MDNIELAAHCRCVRFITRLHIRKNFHHGKICSVAWPLYISTRKPNHTNIQIRCNNLSLYKTCFHIIYNLYHNMLHLSICLLHFFFETIDQVGMKFYMGICNIRRKVLNKMGSVACKIMHKVA